MCKSQVYTYSALLQSRKPEHSRKVLNLELVSTVSDDTTTPQTGPRGEAAVTKLGERQIRGGEGDDRFLTGHGTPISTPSISKLDKGGGGGGGGRKGGERTKAWGGGQVGDERRVDKSC